MSRVVVIGVGSPMENDHIAWDVIELLGSNADLHTYTSMQLSLLKSDRPGSRLIEHMHAADFVILLDTLQGEQTEAYLCLTPQQLQEEAVLLSSHGFGVAEALQLAKALSCLPSVLLIYGISTWAEPLEIADVLATEIIKALGMSRQG